MPRVHRLRLARPRRIRLRLSLAALVLPAVGLLVLLQAAPLQTPLSESEADLAIAVRYPARELTAEAGGAGAAATALVAIGPSLLGTSEFRLRAAGVLAGCFALGLVVWLGERLFSTATGVLTAVILLSTTTGRVLLGTEFTVEPFFLVAMLAALGAMRNLASDRRSAIRGGIASGTAIALVGASALFLPVMTLVWLWRLHGLGPRSFAVVVSTTAAAAAAVAGASALALGFPLDDVLPAAPATPAAPSTRALLEGGLELLPVLPPILVGLAHVPARWRSWGSPRFLALWLALAAVTAWWTGAVAPLWIALCMSAALVSTWALGGASRRVVLATIGASVLLAIGLDASLPDRDDSDGHDRWAVRETGKFVRRNLDSASTVAAASEARGRLAYYATRPIAVLDRPSGFDGLDYVVLDRAALATAGARRASRPPPREIELDGRPLRVVAEFGPWVLARVGATGEAVTVPDPGKSVESPEEPVKSASELRKVRSERLAEKAN